MNLTLEVSTLYTAHHLINTSCLEISWLCILGWATSFFFGVFCVCGFFSSNFTGFSWPVCKVTPGNVLPRQKTFLFVLKTEFQSNNGQFLDLLCLTIPVFIGRLPLRFWDRGNHRALSIPICFFQFPSFLPNLHHFLCPLVFRSFKMRVYCTPRPLSP